MVLYLRVKEAKKSSILKSPYTITPNNNPPTIIPQPYSLKYVILMKSLEPF
jgi:hypothetical protein